MPQVTTSTSAAIAAPQNRLRKSIVFQNVDSTDSIYLDNQENSTITTANASIKLAPGQAIAFNDLLDGSAQIQASWQCIASANTPKLLWKETEDVVR